MSKSIGKYVALGAAAVMGAGLVYLGVSVKRTMGLIITVIELEEQFEELYTKHGVDGREELVKQYNQRTQEHKGSSWRNTYRELLIEHWEKFVAKQTQKESNDGQPDE